MKKILFVFLALVVTAALGFSQDLKFDGYVNSGLGLVITDGKDAEGGDINPQIRIMGVDSEQRGGRFRLNGAYTSENKNTGANFRFQLQGQSIASTSLASSFAYGWFKPVDMLTIKAGIVDDAVWETAGAILKDDQGEGAGILARLSPVGGLDIGLGAYAWSQLGGNDNNAIATPGVAQNWWDAKYTFMASYTMPKMFKLNLSGRSFNASGNNTSARFIGEFRLLAVENLTAIAEVELDKLFDTNEDWKYDSFKEQGLFNIFETIAYSMGDLKFGLNAAQYISNVEEQKDMGLRFNPWISYALNEGKVVPRLDAVYFIGGNRQGDGRYDRRTEFAPNYNGDSSVISGRPSVKFNLDSRTTFEIGDAFYYQKPASGDAVTTNVLYTDLVLRF